MDYKDDDPMNEKDMVMKVTDLWSSIIKLLWDDNHPVD